MCTSTLCHLCGVVPGLARSRRSDCNPPILRNDQISESPNRQIVEARILPNSPRDSERFQVELINPAYSVPEPHAFVLRAFVKVNEGRGSL
jgi:hypothetical protein